MLLLTIVFATTSTQAQLKRVGPVSASNGFPQWYQDNSGLTMEFCQNLSQAELNGGWCRLLPPVPPTAPEVFPTNFADEHFYWGLNAGALRAPIAGSTQTVVVSLVAGLEGAFATGPVISGNQIVFARVRIKIKPIPYDGTYTVYTPFGKFVFENQLASDPRGLFFTEDVGLTPGDFTLALNGRIGPFLLPSANPGGAEMPALTAANPTPDSDPAHFGGAFVPTPYPGTGKSYIADPKRLGPITGSPIANYLLPDGTTRNANIFRIEGPNGFVYETTDFSLSGRVFEGAIAGRMQVDRASYARSASGNKVDVYATAFPNVQGRLPAGQQPAPITTHLSFFDVPCSATLDAAGNPGPPFSAPAGATPTQMLANGSNYYGQSQPAAIAQEVCVQANAVDAGGQTVSTFIPTLLGDQVFITEALYDPASQSLSVKANSSDQVIAQTLVVEGLGNIDSASGQLLVSPLLAPPAKIRVISSGSGLNEFQVNTGAVAGGGPILPIAVNDGAATSEDTAVTINVLGNDTNAAGGTVSLVSLPALGTAVVNPDGSILYTPNLNANGTDSFSYHVIVGAQVSNEASVTITIAPVNDPPVAVNDAGSALRGVPNSINVLANDTDPDGFADLARAVIVTGNANLGITAGTSFAGGVVTFTPPATAVGGVYTFTYNAVDQSGVASATPATVTITLTSAESITPAKGIYTTKTGRWTVSGTASPSAGQTMRIAYDPGTVATYKVNGACTGNAAGAVLANVTVDATGTWTYDQILASTAGVLNPSNTSGNSAGFWCVAPKTLRITSALSGASATIAISLK
ncbi:MAG: cadherin-like domain-containing protein [Acidobacteriia bacterium]|nr:cadherin-like domain-containing protein [Terriglobia bacterium]